VIRRHVTPALIVFPLLLTGCLLARSLSPWLFAAAAAGLAAAGVAFLAPPVRMRRAGLLLMAASIGAALAGLSVQRMAVAAARAHLPVPPADVSSFSGVATQDSGLSRSGMSVVRLSLERAASARHGLQADARGAVLLFIPGDYRFSIGERLEARAALQPFDSTGPERFAARVQRSELRTLGFAGGVWELRARCRAWLHRAVAAAGYPASALLEALLIGSREDVPPSLYDSFMKTGSLHILALSGLHVTVIFGLVMGLLGFIRARGVRFALAALALLCYQLLAGFMPSLLRATVMILAGGAAMLLDRDREPLNALCVSGIVLLLIDPFQAFTLSFQLSFLALAGILLLGPVARRPLEGRVPAAVLTPLAMSVGAQAATLPLVVAQFGAWYPSGLAAGLVLVPLTTAYLWAGLAWLPLSAIPWPFLHGLCARGFALFYQVIEECARLMALAPGVTVGAPAAGWAAAGAAIAAAAAAVALPVRRRGVRGTVAPARRGLPRRAAA
jgi:competence protein ComEC